MNLPEYFKDQKEKFTNLNTFSNLDSQNSIKNEQIDELIKNLNQSKNKTSDQLQNAYLQLTPFIDFDKDSFNDLKKHFLNLSQSYVKNQNEFNLTNIQEKYLEQKSKYFNEALQYQADRDVLYPQEIQYVDNQILSKPSLKIQGDLNIEEGNKVIETINKGNFSQIMQELQSLYSLEEQIPDKQQRENYLKELQLKIDEFIYKIVENLQKQKKYEYFQPVKCIDAFNILNEENLFVNKILNEHASYESSVQLQKNFTDNLTLCKKLLDGEIKFCDLNQKQQQFICDNFQNKEFNLSSIKELKDQFSLNSGNDPMDFNFFLQNSMTTDGKYLYIYQANDKFSVIMKVGTGKMDTQKGKIYLKKQIQNLEQQVSWVYIKGFLFLKAVQKNQRKKIRVQDISKFGICSYQSPNFPGKKTEFLSQPGQTYEFTERVQKQVEYGQSSHKINFYKLKNGEGWIYDRDIPRDLATLKEIEYQQNQIIEVYDVENFEKKGEFQIEAEMFKFENYQVNKYYKLQTDGEDLYVIGIEKQKDALEKRLKIYKENQEFQKSASEQIDKLQFSDQISDKQMSENNNGSNNNKKSSYNNKETNLLRKHEDMADKMLNSQQFTRLLEERNEVQTEINKIMNQVQTRQYECKKNHKKLEILSYKQAKEKKLQCHICADLYAFNKFNIYFCKDCNNTNCENCILSPINRDVKLVERSESETKKIKEQQSSLQQRLCELQQQIKDLENDIVQETIFREKLHNTYLYEIYLYKYKIGDYDEISQYFCESQLLQIFESDRDLSEQKNVDKEKTLQILDNKIELSQQKLSQQEKQQQQKNMNYYEKVLLYQRQEQTNLQQSNKNIVQILNKISYFKFGENRHKNLSLSNKCIIKNGNQEGYKFALLDPELTSRCQFAFKMLQGDFKWTALGVCDYQKIKDNNFEITDFKIGHGLFVVINNGGTLSSNDQDYNNKFMSPFQFKQGDIIICTYDPEYCDIEFKKYSTQEKLKLRLKKCVRDPLRICVLFKGGNQDEIQYIEKIDHLQYYTDTQTLSRLKKKRLIDELIESSEHSFSPKLKHRNLKITNKCTIKSEGPNGYKFGLLEKPLTRKKKWAFKMLEGTFKWVAIGICHIETIKEKNFIFEPMNIGHGAYMISQNAGTWSNIQSEFNNQVKAFKFGLGYIIIVEYDPENNLLSFYNERNPKESYSLKIKQEENNPFHICVVTHFNSDEIQYIDSVDQIPHFKEQVYYQWQWNSRLYGENPNLQEWTNYDYLDNQKLNDYYAKNKKDCRVGEFFVEFKAMIQYSVKDINKQRKVRKIQVEKEEEEEFQNEIKDNIWTVGEKTVNLYTQTGVHIFSTEKQNLRPFSLSNQLKITNKEIQKADLLLYEEICKFIESKSTYLETKPHLFLDKLKQNQIYNEFDISQNMINQQMSYHFVLPNYNICFDKKNNLYYVQHYFQMAYMLPLVTVIQNSFNSFKNNKLHQQIETNYVEYGQNCEIEVFKFNVLQMILKLQKYKYYFQGEKSTSQIQAYRKLLQEKVIEYNYSVATGEKTFSLISKTVINIINQMLKKQNLQEIDYLCLEQYLNLLIYWFVNCILSVFLKQETSRQIEELAIIFYKFIQQIIQNKDQELTQHQLKISRKIMEVLNQGKKIILNTNQMQFLWIDLILCNYQFLLEKEIISKKIHKFFNFEKQSLRQNYFVHYSSLNQEILLSNNLNNDPNQNKNKKKVEKIYYSDFSVVEPVGRLLISDVQVFFDQAKLQQQEQEKIQEELEMQNSVADERVSIKSQYAFKFGSQQKKSNQSGNQINFQKYFDKHKQMNFENLVQNQAIKLDRIEDNEEYLNKQIRHFVDQHKEEQKNLLQILKNQCQIYVEMLLNKDYIQKEQQKISSIWTLQYQLFSQAWKITKKINRDQFEKQYQSACLQLFNDQFGILKDFFNNINTIICQDKNEIQKINNNKINQINIEKFLENDVVITIFKQNLVQLQFLTNLLLQNFYIFNGNNEKVDSIVNLINKLKQINEIIIQKDVQNLDFPSDRNKLEPNQKKTINYLKNGLTNTIKVLQNLGFKILRNQDWNNDSNTQNKHSINNDILLQQQKNCIDNFTNLTIMQNGLHPKLQNSEQYQKQFQNQKWKVKYCLNHIQSYVYQIENGQGEFVEYADKFLDKSYPTNTHEKKQIMQVGRKTMHLLLLLVMYQAGVLQGELMKFQLDNFIARSGVFMELFNNILRYIQGYRVVLEIQGIKQQMKEQQKEEDEIIQEIQNVIINEDDYTKLDQMCDCLGLQYKQQDSQRKKIELLQQCIKILENRKIDNQMDVYEFTVQKIANKCLFLLNFKNQIQNTKKNQEKNENLNQRPIVQQGNLDEPITYSPDDNDLINEKPAIITKDPNSCVGDNMNSEDQFLTPIKQKSISTSGEKREKIENISNNKNKNKNEQDLKGDSLNKLRESVDQAKQLMRERQEMNWELKQIIREIIGFLGNRVVEPESLMAQYENRVIWTNQLYELLMVDQDNFLKNYYNFTNQLLTHQQYQRDGFIEIFLGNKQLKQQLINKLSNQLKDQINKFTYTSSIIFHQIPKYQQLKKAENLEKSPEKFNSQKSGEKSEKGENQLKFEYEDEVNLEIGEDDEELLGLEEIMLKYFGGIGDNYGGQMDFLARGGVRDKKIIQQEFQQKLNKKKRKLSKEIKNKIQIDLEREINNKKIQEKVEEIVNNVNNIIHVLGSQWLWKNSQFQEYLNQQFVPFFNQLLKLNDIFDQYQIYSISSLGNILVQQVLYCVLKLDNEYILQQEILEILNKQLEQEIGRNGDEINLQDLAEKQPSNQQLKQLYFNTQQQYQMKNYHFVKIYRIQFILTLIQDIIKGQKYQKEEQKEKGEILEQVNREQQQQIQQQQFLKDDKQNQCGYEEFYSIKKKQMLQLSSNLVYLIQYSKIPALVKISSRILKQIIENLGDFSQVSIPLIQQDNKITFKIQNQKLNITDLLMQQLGNIQLGLDIKYSILDPQRFLEQFSEVENFKEKEEEQKEESKLGEKNIKIEKQNQDKKYSVSVRLKEDQQEEAILAIFQIFYYWNIMNPMDEKDQVPRDFTSELEYIQNSNQSATEILSKFGKTLKCGECNGELQKTNGPYMQQFVSWSCNVCNKGFKFNDGNMNCQKCQYDICFDCYDKENEQILMSDITVLLKMKFNRLQMFNDFDDDDGINKKTIENNFIILMQNLIFEIDQIIGAHQKRIQDQIKMFGKPSENCKNTFILKSGLNLQQAKEFAQLVELSAQRKLQNINLKYFFSQEEQITRLHPFNLAKEEVILRKRGQKQQKDESAQADDKSNNDKNNKSGKKNQEEENENVNKLMEFGFTENQVKWALLDSKNNLEIAANNLLAGLYENMIDANPFPKENWMGSPDSKKSGGNSSNKKSSSQRKKSHKYSDSLDESEVQEFNENFVEKMMENELQVDIILSGDEIINELLMGEDKIQIPLYNQNLYQSGESMTYISLNLIGLIREIISKNDDQLKNFEQNLEQSLNILEKQDSLFFLNLNLNSISRLVGGLTVITGIQQKKLNFEPVKLKDFNENQEKNYFLYQQNPGSRSCDIISSKTNEIIFESVPQELVQSWDKLKKIDSLESKIGGKIQKMAQMLLQNKNLQNKEKKQYMKYQEQLQNQMETKLQQQSQKRGEIKDFEAILDLQVVKKILENDCFVLKNLNDLILDKILAYLSLENCGKNVYEQNFLSILEELADEQIHRGSNYIEDFSEQDLTVGWENLISNQNFEPNFIFLKDMSKYGVCLNQQIEEFLKKEDKLQLQQIKQKQFNSLKEKGHNFPSISTNMTSYSRQESNFISSLPQPQLPLQNKNLVYWEKQFKIWKMFREEFDRMRLKNSIIYDDKVQIINILYEIFTNDRNPGRKSFYEKRVELQRHMKPSSYDQEFLDKVFTYNESEKQYEEFYAQENLEAGKIYLIKSKRFDNHKKLLCTVPSQKYVPVVILWIESNQALVQHVDEYNSTFGFFWVDIKNSFKKTILPIKQEIPQFYLQSNFQHQFTNLLSNSLSLKAKRLLVKYYTAFDEKYNSQIQIQNQNQIQLNDNLQENDEKEQIVMNSDFLYVDQFEKYFNEKNNTDLLPLILEWVMEHELKGQQIEGWIKALDSQIIPDQNKIKEYQLYNINQQERDLKYGNLKTFERLFYKLANQKNFDINPQNNLLIKLINMAQKDLQRMINFVIKNQITLDLLKVEREDNINQFPQFEETQINSLIFTFTSQSHMPLTSKINFYSDKKDDSKLIQYKHVGLDKEQHFISPIIVKGREIYCQFYLNQGEQPITFEAAKVERGNLDCLVFGVPEKWNSVCWLIDSISSAFTQNFNNFNSLKDEKFQLESEKSGLVLKEMQKLNRFLSQQMLELSRGPNYLKQQISWLITRVTRKIQYIVFQSQQDLGDLKKQHFAIIGVEEKTLFRILEEVKQIEQQEQREFKLPSAYNQNLIEMCSTILSPLSQKISKKIFSYTHRDIVIDKLPEFMENMVNVQNIYKFLDKQGILTNQLYQQTVDSQSQWSNMICINNLPQDKSVNEMRQLIISILKKSRRRIINEELDIIIPSLKDLVTHEGVCFIITDGSQARVEEESKTEDEKEEDMFNELYMDGTQCQNCNLQMINTCSSCDELVQSILKNLPNASLCFGRSIIQNQNFNKYLSSILKNRLLKIKQQDEKYLKFLPNIKSDQLNDKVLKALQKSYQNIKISEELQAHVKRSYSGLNIQNINSFIQSFQNIVQAGNALNAFQILSDFGFNLWLNEGTYAINEAPKSLPQSQIEQMLQKCQNIRFLYDNTQMDQKDARFTRNLLRVLSINLEKCFPYISISKENNRFISVFSKENEQLDFIELQISNYLEKYRQLLIRTTKLEMQQKVLNKTAIKDLNGFTLNLPYVYIDKNKNLPQFIQAYYSLLNIPRNQFMPIKSADKGVPFVCFEIISQTTAQGAGGLFRQFFNDVSLELKNDRKGPGQDYVPLLVQHNEKKEEYMINKKANSPFNLQLFEFLGVLMGCSIRTNTPLSINLPMIFWKLLVEEDISQQDWIEYRLKTESGEFERIFDEDMINQIKEAGEEIFSDQYFERQVQKINQMRNKFIINNLNNENQEKIAQIQKKLGNFSASFENLDEIIPNYCKSLLYDIVFQMKYLKRGLNSVVPYPLLKITSAKDLEIMVCGVYTIDIDLLKKNTVYEGMDTDGKKLNENSKRIKMLWEALESDKYFSIEDKRKFIQFCYAVDRLPMTDQEYKQQGIVFKISANTSKKALNDPDNCFISAQTCFFQLKLPDYSGIEALVKQIRLSIQGAGNELSE